MSLLSTEGPSPAPLELEAEPLINVVVMFGEHRLADWAGPASEAPAIEAAWSQRFGLRVETRPVPDVPLAGAEAVTTPVVVGFYKTDPLVPVLADTAVLAALQVWCRREGYQLGTPFRQQDGNGALDAMLTALERREEVIGVIVPSLDHLGPGTENRVSRIRATGKQLFVAYPSDVRR